MDLEKKAKMEASDSDKYIYLLSKFWEYDEVEAIAAFMSLDDVRTYAIKNGFTINPKIEGQDGLGFHKNKISYYTQKIRLETNK